MTDASFDRYLAGEVGPFAAAAADGESIWELTRKPGFPDNVRPLMKRLYRDTGNLAYKRAVTRGCRELYGFKGEWIDWDDRRLFERAAEARAGGIAALYLDVMARANIQHVLRLCSPWDDTIRLPASRQGFLMYVDGLVAARREMPRQAARGRARTAATLDEHLRAVGSHLSAAKSAGAVGLKVGLATRRSLRFEAVSMRASPSAFWRPPRVDPRPADRVGRFHDAPGGGGSGPAGPATGFSHRFSVGPGGHRPRATGPAPQSLRRLSRHAIRDPRTRFRMKGRPLISVPCSPTYLWISPGRPCFPPRDSAPPSTSGSNPFPNRNSCGARTRRARRRTWA